MSDESKCPNCGHPDECRNQQRYEILALRARVADQDAWIAQYNENSDLIGEALDRIREKRFTGEPARPDWHEVRDLVARVEALEAALNEFGWHNPMCRSRFSDSRGASTSLLCNCGWDATRKALAPARSSGAEKPEKMEPVPHCPRCDSEEWFPGGACWHCGWEGSAAEAYEFMRQRGRSGGDETEKGDATH